MKISEYIFPAMLICTSCNSLIKGSYIEQSKYEELSGIEKNDSSYVQEIAVDTTLPRIHKDTLIINSVSNIKAFFEPVKELKLKSNRKCVYRVTYPGGGINGPSIVESLGKYYFEKDQVVIKLNKSRAYKNKGWSPTEEIDKTIRFNYNGNYDTLWRQRENTVYVKSEKKF